ncbi:MAG: hypothetical protein JNL09_00725 [Anaerolineales bacterium]|nr:hypothetical protein [Anaerolineales bacterium]
MGENHTATPEIYLSEAHRLIAAVTEARLMVRLFGSLAFQLRCPTFSHLRASFNDIDFGGYNAHAKAMAEVMARLGYAENREVFVLTEGGRAIFEHPTHGLHVDVFYEKLDFCHTLKLSGRLEVDAPTLPLAELLLGKMQIVEINEKDLVDTFMLLLEHPLSETDKAAINLAHVARLCADDWGLWRTVTMNLNKTKELAVMYAALNAEQQTRVVNQAEAILHRLNAQPKSFAWRLRARVGDRVKWYNDVEEVNG